MLTYRATLDVSTELAHFVAGLLAVERSRRGTRRRTRALSCFRQAVLVLRWFRDRTDPARLGRDHAVSRATAYRYIDEAVTVLAGRAPDLGHALDKAAADGLTHLILDGTVISADRCTEKTTSKKGNEIDLWYSGKAHQHGGNTQALCAPGGFPRWVSGVEPGSAHDITAARHHVLPGACHRGQPLPILADLGYEGAGHGVHTPVKNPPGGELDTDTRTYNQLLRGLRSLGERGFAVLTGRWRALQRVTASPGKIGDIAKAALVLTHFEHGMIT